MRYKTLDGFTIEAESAIDVVRALKDDSPRDRHLDDVAFMQLVARQVFEQQGVHVATFSPAVFVAGLLIAEVLYLESE